MNIPESERINYDGAEVEFYLKMGARELSGSGRILDYKDGFFMVDGKDSITKNRVWVYLRDTDIVKIVNMRVGVPALYQWRETTLLEFKYILEQNGYLVVKQSNV